MHSLTSCEGREVFIRNIYSLIFEYMTQELEFWLSALKDAKKQFVMAKGAYESVAGILTAKKCDNVIAGINNKVFASKLDGNCRPIYVDLKFHQYWNLVDEPRAILFIHFVRDIDDVLQFTKLSPQESRLVDKFEEIYPKLTFDLIDSPKANVAYLKDLEEIRLEQEKIDSQRLLYANPQWNFEIEDIFSDGFIERGLKLCDRVLLPSGDNRRKDEG